jgi:ribosomal protein S21
MDDLKGESLIREMRKRRSYMKPSEKRIRRQAKGQRRGGNI